MTTTTLHTDFMSGPMTNAATFKERMRMQWDAAAASWNARGLMTRERLREPNGALMALAGICDGRAMLDVAAGAADRTLDIAARVGAGGTAIATEIPDLTDIDRRN